MPDLMPDLSGLKDIHLPTEISAWPLAIHVQLIIILFCAGLVLVCAFCIKKYQKNRPKRIALRLLAQYQSEYASQQNMQKTSAQISELLKRVALAYFPRKEVAGLEGDAWIDFLNRNGEKLDFNIVKNELLVLPYYPKYVGELQSLFQLTRQWILQRSQPCQP